MKKINKKYLAAAILAGGATILPLAGSASAATDNTTVIELKAAATTTITVSVPDKITFETAAGSTESDEVSYTISNTSSGAQIKVTNLKVVANGYDAVAYTSDFKSYARDAKKYAVAITKIAGAAQASPIDLYNTGNGSNRSETINNGGSITYTLKAKATTVKDATTTTPATIGKITPTFGW